MKYIKEFGLYLLTFILLIALLLVYYLKDDRNVKTIDLNIVPTNVSELSDNSIWCPTFQLIWNDMKTQIIGHDIVFINDEENTYAKDLNKGSFTDKMISSEYYYKNYGYRTIELRDTIKNDIMEKFNEKSDILDNFNFEKESKDYFLYSMLIRKFSFKEPFDILDKDTFGINDESKEELNDNIKVLYYKDATNYAVKLLTKEKDEVILYKGERSRSFNDTFDLIKKNSKESTFNKNDKITVANMKFKLEKDYKEISNKAFNDINGDEFYIEKAIQIVEFTLDNTGGKVKSEAGIALNKSVMIEDSRFFDFSNNFVLFLKEESKDYPYLAINVKDIRKFQ